ncbi:unnamed protein product [Effrenium voratum]|nr:unnamed protein product [Effrenium voratum]
MWDAVRAKSPMQILPARLYSHEQRIQPVCSPEANPLGALEMWRDRAPLQLPALLSGETEEDRHRFLLQQREAGQHLSGEKGCHSQASTRAGSSMAEASRPATAMALEERRRPGTAPSQGLQKSLQMKKRQEKIAQANSARRLCWQAAEEHRHRVEESRGQAAA